MLIISSSALQINTSFSATPSRYPLIFASITRKRESSNRVPETAVLYTTDLEYLPCVTQQKRKKGQLQIFRSITALMLLKFHTQQAVILSLDLNLTFRTPSAVNDLSITGYIIRSDSYIVSFLLFELFQRNGAGIPIYHFCLFVFGKFAVGSILHLISFGVAVPEPPDS